MRPEQTPYWWAFLKHPLNQAVALGLVAGALALSVPWGSDGLGLGLLALAAVELVGLATVPALAPFRAWVDKRDRSRAREARRQSLHTEVLSQGGSPHLRSYEQMAARVVSLYRTASDRTSGLTEREVEQLDDIGVDYLRMCLSDAVLKGSKAVQLPPQVEYKLRDIENRLAAGGLPRDEELQLRQAKADYDEAIARQKRMATRRSALEATLVSMPVRLEELYQMVMTAPRGGNLSQMLEESVSKLRLAEEAVADIEGTLGDASAGVIPIHSKASARDQRRTVGQRI
jgi:hypothetical protein